DVERATSWRAAGGALCQERTGPRWQTRVVREIACDAIVFSGQWLPETACLSGSPVEIDQRTNGPVVDQVMRTSCRGVFAAGNVLHGVESSGWCAVEGARAGASVARYLRGEIEAAQGHVEFVRSPENRLHCSATVGLPADAPGSGDSHPRHPPGSERRAQT